MKGNLSKMVRDLGEGIKELAKVRGFPVVDVYRALQGSDGTLDVRYDFSDGVHLSVAGYEALGRTVSAAVAEFIEGGGNEEETGAAQGEFRIVCIGDSITRGYPYSEYPVEVQRKQGFRPYPSFLEGPGRRVDNLGVNGDTTAGVFRRLLETVLPIRPNICIPMVGVNDLLMGASVERTLVHWKDILDALRVEKVPSLVCTPTPVARGL